MPINDISNEKVFFVDENDMATLIERVEPMNTVVILLIKETMVE